jgi:uncharacterized membrane protein
MTVLGALAATVLALADLVAQTSDSTTIEFDPALAIVGILIGGGVGAAIGSTKNRTGLGFVLGALLGCIGWIITAVLSKKSRY